MFNIDLPYKSATPMKFDRSTKAWFKKKKLLHPPSCTLDAVKVLKHHSQETNDDRK